MSLKDLREAGVLLPEDEWGKHDLHTSVNKVALTAAFLFGLVSIALMYMGGGETLTFVGGVMFLGFMVWITQLSLKAIDVQVAQLHSETEQIHEAEAAGEQTATTESPEE